MIPTTAPSPLNPWLNPCLVPQEDKQEQHLGIIDSYSSPRCQSRIISLHIALVCHTLYTAACCRYQIQSSSKTNKHNPCTRKNFLLNSRGKVHLKNCTSFQQHLHNEGELSPCLYPEGSDLESTTFADFQTSECQCLVCSRQFTGSVLHRCWFTQEMAHAAWLGWSQEIEA